MITAVYRLELTLGHQSETDSAPVNAILLVGPPGTGKTYLTTSLSRAARDCDYPLQTFVIPMAKYNNFNNVGELTGVGRHFSGGGKEGELMRIARLGGKKPYIVVFDEIDRACKEAMNLLLSLLSEGCIYDTHSQEYKPVRFDNALLVFTSNAGPFSGDISHSRALYGNGPVLPQEVLKDALKKSICKDSSRGFQETSFPEAFLDRIQAVVPFKHLGIDEKEQIAGREIKAVQQRLETSGIQTFEYDDTLLTHIVLHAGALASARQVIAVVRDKVEKPVMQRILWSDQHFDTVRLGYGDPKTGQTLESRFYSHMHRILYVEDDPDWQQRVAESIAACQQSTGQVFDLKMVNSPSEAWNVLEQGGWVPDVLLLDLLFPDDDPSASVPGGLTFLQNLRRTHPGIPVIIFSDLLGSEKDEAYWSCIREGAAGGYIPKNDMTGSGLLAESLKTQLRSIGCDVYQTHLMRGGKQVMLDFLTDAFENSLALMVDSLEEKSVPTIEDAGWFKVMTEHTSFDQLIGVDRIVEDLRLAVSYLKNPGAFAGTGAVPPFGYVLHGPPGTGKTSIARALAGESDALFISCEASEFRKKYVGEGADKVRELFAIAGKYTPVVVFIDELDALGSRETDREGAIDVLNAFLSALDGFDKQEGLIVIGATNRLEAIDKALTRPGRLGKKVLVDIPRDRDTRMKLINMYFPASGITLDETARDLAVRLSAGMSPADIREWARQLAWRRYKDRAAIMDRRLLVETRTATLKSDAWEIQPDEEAQRKTAYHEAGHGVVACHFHLPILQISILARAETLGVLEFSSEDVQHSENMLKARLAAFFGGCEAENLVFETGYSEGSYSDMVGARNLAEKMVCDLGMWEGRIPLGRNGDRSLTEAAHQAVNKLLAQAQKSASDVLTQNREQLDALVRLLLENKTVFQDEMEQL